MYCDVRCAISPKVITRKRATALRVLPPASEVAFPGVFAWSPVTSAAVTSALGVDPGAWNVWRNRRLTPAPMPAAWFQRTTGSPLIYRVSDILTWLAARRGDRLDTLTTWRLSLLRDFETDVLEPHQVRSLVKIYARAKGPRVGQLTFTPAGFRAYLERLM